MKPIELARAKQASSGYDYRFYSVAILLMLMSFVLGAAFLFALLSYELESAISLFALAIISFLFGHYYYKTSFY